MSDCPDEQFPLVSVGMPLFNEGRFLRKALQSLLAQDYPRFEILISDNASTDETAAICKEFVALDPRVKYVRLSENLGAAENFRRVSRMANGLYFMWAGGHDIWAANLLSTCVAALEQNPGAVIAFGTWFWIDEYGRPFPKYTGWTDTRGLSPTARFFTVLWGNMHPILGLIRAEALRGVKPFQNLVGADLVLLCDLALRGDFVHEPVTNWCRREFRHEQSHGEKVERYRTREYGLAGSWIDAYLPLARLPIELLRVLLKSDIPAVDKVLAVPILLLSMPLRYVIGKRRPAARA